jgi:hypothetical protein
MSSPVSVMTGLSRCRRTAWRAGYGPPERLGWLAVTERPAPVTTMFGFRGKVMPNTPLVVAVLHSNADDEHYQLYCAAYGIEMQIDDEWDAELVLLAPHEHLNAVTEDTGVTGDDPGIVSAGVTDVPTKKSGKPDLSAIKSDRNNWLLIGGAGNTDSEQATRAKLHAAVDAGCRVVLCFSETVTGQLPARLEGFDPRRLSQLVIAYTGPDAARPAAARAALRCVQDSLRSTLGTPAGCRFIVGGKATARSAVALTAIPNVSGVLMEAGQYSDFGDILDVLKALGESDEG